MILPLSIVELDRSDIAGRDDSTDAAAGSIRFAIPKADLPPLLRGADNQDRYSRCLDPSGYEMTYTEARAEPTRFWIVTICGGECGLLGSVGLPFEREVYTIDRTLYFAPTPPLLCLVCRRAGPSVLRLFSRLPR